MSLICRYTGQPKEICFCADCRFLDSDTPWENKIQPTELKALVEHIVIQIKTITENVRKANPQPMAQQNNNNRQRPQNGIQRLDLKDLSSDKKRLKILAAVHPSVAGVNADWAIVSLKLLSIASNVKRTYTIGENNPVYDCLREAFGDDFKKWTDREVFAWKVVEGFNEKEFMRFACIDDKGKEIEFEYPSGDEASSQREF